MAKKLLLHGELRARKDRCANQELQEVLVEVRAGFSLWGITGGADLLPSNLGGFKNKAIVLAWADWPDEGREFPRLHPALLAAERTLSQRGFRVWFTPLERRSGKTILSILGHRGWVDFDE